MGKISLSLDHDYRWPRRGDRLLPAATTGNKAVSFSDDPVSRHAYIWAGYMRAGSDLIGVCESDPGGRHELIYPILFLYRHALETAMKWIVGHYGRYVGISLSSTDHNLWQLWRSSKTIIITIGGEGDGFSAGVVEQIIKDFHDLDPAGLSFRYPVNKNGAFIALPGGQTDLAKLRDVMAGVAHFFEGADAQLSDYSYEYSCEYTYESEW